MELFSALRNKLFLIFSDWKIILVLTIIISLYYYLTNTFDHFEKKGIPYMKPVILLGNMGPRFNGTKSFHEYQVDIYEYFKGKPFGGIFEGKKPILYIRDTEILKAVTIRDFDHFTDRVCLDSKEPEYLRRILLNLKGSEWKSVRSTLTPAFSSARLKNMFPLIQHCEKQMMQFLRKYDQQEIELKSTMGHYTLEVIGACAFGIECDALSDERSHFLKMAEKFDKLPTFKRIMFMSVMTLAPELIRYLNVSFVNKNSTDELVRMLKAAKAERKTATTKNNDFLQILLDFAKKEKMELHSEKNKIELDDDTIDGQCLLFLIAGYDTSSSLLSFGIHVLATNPDLQEKLRTYVKEMTEGKEITYDLLTEMTYLEGFLLETLRVYPPVARVERVCTKPYVLPGTDVKLNVGDALALPIYAYHMDPEIYPEPHVFRPERFMNEEKKERPAHLFLAFGTGPRICIGLRFAMLSAKAAMIGLVKNFKFTASTKTPTPVEFDKQSMLLRSETGLWVRVESL